MSNDLTPTMGPNADPKAQVIAWLIEGHTDHDIKQAIAQHWPNRAATKLLRAAVDHFAEAAQCDVDVVIGWALELYRELIRKNLASGDLAEARKVIKDMVDLAAKHGVHSETENKDGLEKGCEAREIVAEAAAESPGEGNPLGGDAPP